jgi:hypothetical protein
LVFGLGVAAAVVYVVHRGVLDNLGLHSTLMPIFGGVFELVILWFFWMAILELWRNGRPLHREWRLWAGMVAAWIPPTADLLRSIATWKP